MNFRLLKSVPLVLVILVVLLPGAASAAAGHIVSGPSGHITNGWYNSQPTITVDTTPACPDGTHTFSIGGYKGEGLHHITVRAYLSTHPSMDYLDGKDGVETNAATWSCTSLSSSYDGNDPIIVWQGDIRWDSTAPQISITSPATNSNSTDGMLKVSGKVFDSTSGVDSVTVNGIAATVNGNSFTATIPLSMGLNTVLATARDVAGNSQKSNSVIINRLPAATENTPASGNGASETTNQNGSSTSSNDSQQTTLYNKSNDKKEVTGSLVSTVAKTGGVSILGVFLIAALIIFLDKLGILEIKILPGLMSKTKRKFHIYKNKA